MIPALGSSAATTAAATTATATAGSNADFNTFLKMLTAQLKNQDPLNPMEGTEFAVQLATFSGVEQQAQTNKLLNQMIAQLGGGGLGQMADWIGKEGRTTEPVWFGDTALTLDVRPEPAADSVVLVARNAAGREISREEIGPGAGQIDWFGRDDTGTKLPDGQYSFVIESSRNGEVIAEDEVGVYARIIEAATGSNGIELIFEGGSSAPASEVSALREPG
ncbi:flagellar hook capping FlgD N-terminal domain-containing protein [Paracoccus spongiarum]|uniref:Basal-body rod modification protein FlgD n=1 Tax=Paracoccus spongiarum TaxID=3064387 RepID=A0ABT9JG32_9RHOB|nr:flagellar hook capping FlgD N-terminal domain-containing protein [Paracoccus sp. 2205BS29-5]MDP5308773.1 flagellar hook capping FlgD N-terminal domain-containing protein [Paracoccus sp. 2205BS29-5]